MSHLEFIQLKTKKLTVTYQVKSTYTGAILGVIKFKSQWRQFCLYPEPGTWWSDDCLHDAMKLCTLLTQQWRLSK